MRDVRFDELLRAMLVLSGHAGEHLQGQHDQSTHRNGGGGGSKKSSGLKSWDKSNPRDTDTPEWKNAVASWVTSNELGASVALELIASEEFGGKVITSKGEIPDKKTKRVLKDNDPDGRMQDGFKAQYDKTQKVLNQKYPTGYVTVYRGVSEKIPTGERDVELDALSSWTTDKSKARTFAYGGSVITANIPIEHVLASPETNPRLRTAKQGEYLILGMDDTIRVSAERNK